MRPDIEYAVKKFETACRRLEEAVKQAVDELDRDGVIQRFEFTFELLWKTSKVLVTFKSCGIMQFGPKRFEY